MRATWILVADRGGARLFSGDIHKLTLIQDFPHAEGRLKDHEIDSDKPGRSFDSVGSARHAEGSDRKPSINLANEFAHTLAQMLEKGRTDHRYDRLVLVADRKFLGRLRASISSDTARLVRGTLDKDLSGISARDLPAHLKELLEPVVSVS